jgi:hypothetical protein
MMIGSEIAAFAESAGGKSILSATRRTVDGPRSYPTSTESHFRKSARLAAP